MDIYYSIRKSDVDGDDSQPVDVIMQTTGVSYYAMGIYQAGDDYVCLLHISFEDYDMLDAFGVEVMTGNQFGRRHKLKIIFSPGDRFTGVEILG